MLAEATTDPALYALGRSFIAMFTGNPSIVGWDYHQRQQRPWQTEEIRRRIRDVQTAYRTTDPERAYRLLSRYRVSYVVVGGLERAHLPHRSREVDERGGAIPGGSSTTTRGRSCIG